MVGADSGAGNTLGGIDKEGLTVAGVLAALVLLPALLLAGALGGLAQDSTATGPSMPPSATALTEIPPDQLAVMQRVGGEMGIPWQILAAIAKVESFFGQNMATSSAGAIGYGQFLPSTWAAYGRGSDPYNFHDVIPAMARYLLDHGAPTDLRRALYAYNHSWEYVDTVLGHAAAFGPDGAARAPVAPAANSTTGVLGRTLAAALTQQGKPYVWGAAGPDAFDCSGLVQWAFKQAGVVAPRTAQQQFDWARPISLTAVEPGDLLFFEHTYPSVERITHVGLYAGNGQMLNAPAAGAFVRIEPMDTPYWRSHFAGAGRPAIAGVPGAPLVLLQEVRQ
ncbi:MAG: NlpC/P60 family protein [Dehalococcoidia bacterium]